MNRAVAALAPLLLAGLPLAGSLAVGGCAGDDAPDGQPCAVGTDCGAGESCVDGLCACPCDTSERCEATCVCDPRCGGPCGRDPGGPQCGACREEADPACNAGNGPCAALLGLLKPCADEQGCLVDHGDHFHVRVGCATGACAQTVADYEVCMDGCGPVVACREGG